MKNGFTLAEVLITLGIIGVVAALTLPTVINRTKEAELINRTKRTVSVIQNAVLMSQRDYGDIGNNTELFDYNKGYNQVTRDFAKYFANSMVCINSKQTGCKDYFYPIKYAKYRAADVAGNGGAFDYPTLPRIILNDGSILMITELTAGCDAIREDTLFNSDGTIKTDAGGNIEKGKNHVQYCAIIRFDVNGSKLPNQFGQDAFSINIMPDKTTPNSWAETGGQSLTNILSGNGKLIYSKYEVGKPRD